MTADCRVHNEHYMTNIAQSVNWRTAKGVTRYREDAAMMRGKSSPNKPKGNALDAIEHGLKTFTARMDLMIRQHGGEVPLAQKLGITQPAIDKWRHAIQYPRLRELINLVNKLSVSADYLIGANMNVGGLDLERIRLILQEASKSRLWAGFTEDEKFLFLRAIYLRFPAGVDPARTQEIVEKLVEQAIIKSKGNPGTKQSTKP